MSDISEERLRQAVCEAGELLDASLPDADGCSHTFSPAFAKKMDRLLRRRKRLPLYRNLQRAACLFLVFLIGSAVLLSTNAQARQVVFGWVREQLEHSQDYVHQGPVTPSEATKVYTLPQPEGYWLEEASWMCDLGDVLYRNDQGLYIDFSYQYETDKSSSMLSIVTDHADKVSVTVQELPADLYLSHDSDASNTIVWSDPDTGALLQLTAFLGQEDLLALAETVVCKEQEDVLHHQVGVPPEYDLSYERQCTGYFRQDYYDDQRDLSLTLCCQTTSGIGGNLIPPAWYAKTAVQVGTSPALFYPGYPDSQHNTLIWTDQEHQSLVYLEGSLAQADLIALAEGLTPFAK